MEGNKKGEKEPQQTDAEEEQQERQRSPSSPLPLQSTSEAAVISKSSGGVEGGVQTGEHEAEFISAKTPIAPATLSGIPWLAEKAFVLVRFSECFRRGRVIRYDAELNMCVVQLDFTNTVVNKGIEDIFPDDPAAITAATTAEALKRKEQEESSVVSLTKPSGFGSSNVLNPSSAPPSM